MVRRVGDAELTLERLPAVLLVMMIGLYVGVFGTLTWHQHGNYGTFGFDMGLHDQGIWLTSRLETPFVTVRGMNYYGHHVNLVSALYAPAYWLGAGPKFLYLTETIALALGAVPLWLLARLRLGGSGWWALVPAGAWLLHPSVQWINWWHWHPEAMAILPLLFAWWFAATRRWVPFGVAVGLALACKEDVALAVLMLGVVLLLLRRMRSGRAAFFTALGGLTWFVVCTRLVIPAILGATPFYERELFPEFGDSLGSVLWTIVTNPGKVLDLALEAGRVEYYVKLLGPFGVLAPLAGLPVLLVAGPQVGVNVLSSLPGTYDIRFQYSSVVVTAVALASVEGLGWLWRVAGRGPAASGAPAPESGREGGAAGAGQGAGAAAGEGGAAGAGEGAGAAAGEAAAAGEGQGEAAAAQAPRDEILAGSGRRPATVGRAQRALPVVAALAMAVSAVAANVAWSPSPIGRDFDTGIWARRIPRHDVFDRAVAMVPESASVSASYYLIPHLTHRREAYEWPNPWKLVNWGLSGEAAPDPESVDYVVLDRTLHQEEGLVSALTSPGGDYEVLLDEDFVLVARRRG